MVSWCNKKSRSWTRNNPEYRQIGRQKFMGSQKKMANAHKRGNPVKLGKLYKPWGLSFGGILSFSRIGINGRFAVTAPTTRKAHSILPWARSSIVFHAERS